MINKKSLMIRTAGVVSGIYYLSKTVFSADKPLQENLQHIKPKFAYAEIDDLPSPNLLLKETSHCYGSRNEPLWDENWDRRAPFRQTNHQMQRTLLFVRHGEYDKEGPNKRHLNRLGRDQMFVVTERLDALYQAPAQTNVISKMVHSTMVMVEECLEIFKDRLDLTGTEVDSSDFIIEGYPCPPEPMIGPEKSPHIPFRDRARMEAGFRRIFYRPPQNQQNITNEVYICHANVIRYFVMRAMQLPLDAWGRLSIPYGSFTEFKVYGNGHIKTLSIGEQGHHNRSPN